MAAAVLLVSLRRMVLMALACAPLAAVSAAVEARELRISHQWAPEIDARDRAARVFMAEIAKRLPDMKLSIHPKSSLGIGPVEQYDALLDGRIEMAIFPMFYVSPRVPELSITLLPGVPANVAEAQLLKGSDFHMRLQKFCEEKGVHVLTWWWLAGGLVSSSREINGPDDVHGLRVRSGDPTFDVMFSALGATTEIMPSTEIAARMHEGTLDVAQASLESLLSLHINEASKYAIIGRNAIYVSLHPLMISAKVWKSLSDAERKAFEEAATIADKEFQSSQAQIEAQAVLGFVKAGAQVKAMSDEQHEQWLKIANQTSWRAYQQTSQVAAELFRSMLQSLIATGPDAKAKQ